MRLSPNFTLDEFVNSPMAKAHGIDNSVTPAVLKNLYLTAAGMEKVRSILGDEPIYISSGYRCDALNKLVGGVGDSAHLQGYAADFVCPSFGDPTKVIAALKDKLEFDQLIDEQRLNMRWTHISFDPRLRNQIIVAHT